MKNRKIQLISWTLNQSLNEGLDPEVLVPFLLVFCIECLASIWPRITEAFMYKASIMQRSLRNVWWSELISGMSFSFSLTPDLHLRIEPPFPSGIHHGLLEPKETLEILMYLLMITTQLKHLF